jgi:uncharacterized membrane protein YeiH
MRSGPLLFILIETLGIISFAINAMIVAKAKNVSTLGVFFCAALAALGGGTLRDILLGPQALPFFWIAFPFYIVAIFAISVAYANMTTLQTLIGKRDVLIKESAETIALASLGALGAAKTYNLLSPTMGSGFLDVAHILVLCSMMGAISAAFGGILRDIVLNEFPGALKPGVWVLEALFIGALVLALARLAGVPPAWALLAGFIVTLLIRARIVVNAQVAKSGTKS